MNRSQLLRCIFLGLISALISTTVVADEPFRFKDMAEQSELLSHVAGIRGHAAAWGDANNDGWPDLYVGTFHNSGSKPGMLLWNRRGKFELDKQEVTRSSGIGSGALFADLGNRGRLDLYISHCVHGKEGVLAATSVFLRNEGEEKFTDISANSGACPPNFSGRGLCALDYDGDGLLDLLLCEQYYSPTVKTGPLLLRNRGGHRFEAVSQAAGLPTGMGGLAVAAADVNLDGWPDIFLTSGAGEQRLLLNDGSGNFRESPGAREVFRWQLNRPDDTPAGVCIADINRDGLPDIVIGNHFKSPWTEPAPVKLYLHRGNTDGVPRYEDITTDAGLLPLAMKAPHVEIQDFDNDGWPDIYVSVVKFSDGQPQPMIFRNLGVKNGLPRFSGDAWNVNDFPTAEDRAIKRSTLFFEKMLNDKKIIYMAAAPTADYDRDGRLDIFLANWWLESPSLLLRNETPGNRWLAVRVEGLAGVNRQGIGCRVQVFPAGKRGDKATLLGSREIAAGYGYCSGQEAIAHFGLGNVSRVDVEVTPPHGKKTIIREDIPSDQYLVIGEE